MEIPQFWITYRAEIPWWEPRYALFTPSGDFVGLFFTKRGALRRKRQFMRPKDRRSAREAPIVWREDAY